MKQEEVKNEKINKYLSEHQGVLEAPWQLRVNAFKAGWEEALDYFSKLPFDEMLKEFEEYLKKKDENKN